MSELFPTTPTLPTGGDTVSTVKDFSGAMTMDLSDEEIGKAVEITINTHRKHREIWIRKMPFDNLEQVADLLEEFEKELAEKLMTELDVLVKVDGIPCLEGRGPVIDWVGKMPSSSLAIHGQDHERKEWEVKHADERGEDYYGQKGKLKKRKEK